MGSVNVRTGGVFKSTDKLYAWQSGKWKRVHGVYYWGTQGGVTQWWPIWDFGPATLAPPTGFHGTTATHSSGTLVWNTVTHPEIVGYKIALSGIWSPLLGLDTTSYTWTGLGVDSSNTFNIYSVDEFGNIGAASNSVTLRTGHPEVIKQNPSYPGTDYILIWPYATDTWYEGPGRWAVGVATSGPVEQGIQGKYNNGGCRGCVRYDNAWGHFLNGCASWGTSPPPSAVNIDDALMMRIYRNKYVAVGGAVKCMVAPGSINGSDKPIRHGGLSGDHAETWFNSPQPNAERTAFNFAAPDALRTWMKTWMGLGNSFGYGYNGMIILDNVDHGIISQDGTNYVNLAGGLGNGDPNCPWVVRVGTHFRYTAVNYLAPGWG